MTSASRYERLSLWHDGEVPPVSRPPLPGSIDVDVAIVGGGYTGLWTAYYLSAADPTLRIAVLEREIVGFGASGRNGGWCSAIFPASLRKVAASTGLGPARRMQWAMNATVDEVGRVVEAEGINCHFSKGGYVSVARNEAQLARARAEVQTWEKWGLPEQVQLLSHQEALAHVGATNVLGGTYTQFCAAVHPYRLVRGLAECVERQGVKIYEHCPVSEIRPRLARTPFGDVRASVVVRGTEGYTPILPGQRRAIVPMYSLMVATEPIPEEVWAEIGLTDRETFGDKRHLRIYGQRTADGRLAFGGRGAPYHFQSRVDPRFDRNDRVHAMLRRILGELFPVLRQVSFTHAWGGNLGIPRDWYPSVSYDRASGLAAAGGYVGDGVATTNLAARTLRDLILGRDSELLALPWVGHRSPRWEPEPLRWMGVNAATLLFAFADRREARTGRPSASAAAFWRALGH